MSVPAGPAGRLPTRAQWDRLRHVLHAYLERVAPFGHVGEVPDPVRVAMSPGGLDGPEIRAIAAVLGEEPELRAALYIDAVGQPVGSLDAHMVWNFFVGQVVSAYLADARPGPLDQDAFGGLMDRIESEFATATVEASILVPLPGLDLPDGVLELSGGIRLRPVEERERQSWLGAGATDLHDFAAHRARAAIEVTFRYPRAAPIEDRSRAEAEVDQIARRTLRAVQLVADTRVGPLFFERRSHSVLDRGGHHIASNVFERPPFAEGRVDRAMVEPLRATMADIERAAGQARVNLALRRWDDAQRRHQPEDTIIDCWIALESLLCPDALQEVQFRAALRLAALIATPDERAGLYADARRSYYCRSRLVHGEAMTGFNLPVEATRVREWLRRVLLRALHEGLPTEIANIEGRLLLPPEP